MRQASVCKNKVTFVNRYANVVACPTVLSFNFEIDMVDTVNWDYAHDGNTSNLTSGERIRLADIDALERSESGGPKATQFLANLINGKQVYLDVDFLRMPVMERACNLCSLH